MPLICIESGDDYVHLLWDEIPEAKTYTLSMKEGDDTEIEEKVLSTTIKRREIKKKNLKKGIKYYFKIVPNPNLDTPSTGKKNVFEFSTYNQELKFELKNDSDNATTCKKIAPPKLLNAENDNITVQWEKINNIKGYMFRYRELESNWIESKTIISSNQVKKRNLKPNTMYFFSIKPVIEDNDNEYEFSLSSEGISTSNNNNNNNNNNSSSSSSLTLHPSIRNSMPSSLLQSSSGATINIDNALGNKVILLYFSASWCGPCRAFTPKLMQLYNQREQENLSFEVVFVSCDHSKQEMLSYYQKMPWTAIDYDDDSYRDNLSAHFRVNGIPRLIAIDKNGSAVDHNAVQSISIDKLRNWCS